MAFLPIKSQSADDRRSLAARFIGAQGFVDAGEVATGLFISRDQLARTVGLPLTTLSKRDRSLGARPQARLREMLEILSRVEEWAGGEAQALAWYRSQPISALDGRTAEAIVQGGGAASVRSYLDQVALGGFA